MRGFTKNRTVQLSLMNQFLGLVFRVVRLQYFCISGIISGVAIKKFSDESKYEGSFIHSWIKSGLPREFHYKKTKKKKEKRERKTENPTTSYCSLLFFSSSSSFSIALALGVGPVRSVIRTVRTVIRPIRVPLTVLGNTVRLSLRLEVRIEFVILGIEAKFLRLEIARRRVRMVVTSLAMCSLRHSISSQKKAISASRAIMRAIRLKSAIKPVLEKLDPTCS